MTLAIIIVSWNVKELLRACLVSVLADIERDDLPAEVWVVDNASNDGSAAMVRQEFPRVNLIAAETNLGFAGGNNAALQAMGLPDRQDGQPGAVLLLNPDTVIQPGALQAMLTFMQSHPGAGLVGANLTFGDGSFQHGAYGFPGLWQLAIELFPLPGRLYESRLNGRYDRSLYQGLTPFPIDHPLGAVMLVRGEAIRQVGLLDEHYHMYVEEVDWSWRIKAAGWQAYCVPTARIVHLGGQSTGQVQSESFINLWRSRYRFYSRYYAGLKLLMAGWLVQWGMGRKMSEMPSGVKETPSAAETFQTVQKIWRGQEI